MSTLSGESFDIETTDPLLYTLAEDLLSDPQKLDLYERAKVELLGHPIRTLRYDGSYSPITRQTREGYRAYSHPVFSGVDIVSQTLLHISYDHWRPLGDPSGWYVEMRSLKTNATKVLSTVRSEIETDTNRIWLQVESPESIGNWPPGRHPAYSQLRRDQTRIESVVQNGHLERAELRFGMRKSPNTFEDIEVLESMIAVVRHMYGTRPMEHMQEIRRNVTQRLGSIAAPQTSPTVSLPWLVAS
jgi:hypothetical protein